MNGCMISYKDREKKLTCLCKECGEPDTTGKILYMGYGDDKLKALFGGRNIACKKIEPSIVNIEFMPVTGQTDVGWVYKYDGEWQVAEMTDGVYKPLGDIFDDEVGTDCIKQFLQTNHMPVKEQIEALKNMERSPLLDSENMSEVEITLENSSWSTLDALGEDLGCNTEELIRYILLSYVSKAYIGEEMPEEVRLKDTEENND